MKVAKEYKNKVMNFAIANKVEFSGSLTAVGLDSKEDKPQVVIWSDDGSKYKMEETFRYLILVLFIDCLPLIGGYS